MKKIALTLVTLCALALTAFGGWTWVTINGQIYSVWTSSDGRWQTLDGPGGHYDVWNSGRWSEISGPGGFHAEGYHWDNGNVDWTVTNPGRCHRPWPGQ